jgi:glycosyltransferase 2 family protein
VVTAGTTWCCAARWSLVSARVGAPVPLRTAYVAYYRSQLINVTLPGGVVGDVHRGLRHGWRGVVWERGLGQLTQVALVVALVLPSPYRWPALAAVGALAVAGGAVLLLSLGAVAGHLLVFLVAAHAAGASLSPLVLLPVGALVLLGSSIPLNVAGWGPREGVAAWAFTAAGSTAAVGLTVAVTFGLLATVATLPGLLVLRRSPRA